MIDRSSRWTPEPQWSGTQVRSGDCTIFPVPNLAQMLVSGDVAAGLMAMKIDQAGRWGSIAEDTPYVVHLGRMRVLLVSREPIVDTPETSAWFEAGYAASNWSDALAVFEIAGRGTFDFLAQLLAVDLDSARHAQQAGARMRLCDVSIIAYAHRDEERVRLHAERSHAAYVWRLIESAVQLTGG